MSRWLAEGRTLGASLRRFNCIVVAGADSDATAEVALGLAETQAAERHVVLADLLDDAARYAALRVGDDHHGLVDVLHYGITLGRVTQPVAGTAGLVFAPTGSHIADYAELLEHARWPRVIGPFAGSDDLLVLALPLGAAGLDRLVHLTDGVILVDGVAPAKVDPARVIARVQGVKPPTVPPAGAAAAAAGPGVPRDKPVTSVRPSVAVKPAASTPAARPSTKAAARPSTAAPAVDAPRSISRPIAAGKPIPGLNRSVVVGVLLSLVGAMIVYWLADRPMADSAPPARQTAAGVPGLLKTTPTKAPARAIDPNTMDPADSGAAVYAVQIMAANTQAGAILKLQEHGSTLPVATYAPVLIQGTTWFKVVTGAYPTRGGADSLLASLRSEGMLDSTTGVVVRVPFAIRIDSVRAAATVGDALAQLRVGRQLPAYALVQRNGWVWVLVGAFETRSQADMYAQTLRSVGLTPELVYRYGRMY